MYSKLYGKFRAGGQIDYKLNFEKDDVKDGNVLSIFLKPEFQVHQYGSLYAGVDTISSARANSKEPARTMPEIC